MDDSTVIDDMCDQCQGEATLYCNDCVNSYCCTCSSVRHRSESRRAHDIVRVSHIPNVCHKALQPLQRGQQDAHLIGLLMKHFGKGQFKDWQLRVVTAVLGGKNALVVQPTGSGKSLCFQFPCAVTGTLTIVLMPTISLIMDQHSALQRTGLRTTYLGVMQNDRSILQKIAQAQFDIVLSTPESFFDSMGVPKAVFRSLAVQKKVGLVAIDEAHLVRSWRAFRPAYGWLKNIRSHFSDVPLMALTATATPEVIKVLRDTLKDPVCEMASINKPNITYEVQLISPCSTLDKHSNLAAKIIPLIGNQKGLVYVDFVQDVAPLAISLRQNGHKSCGYHGEGMTTHDKQLTLRHWQDRQIQVMVCTSAFGMGIDQPDVEIVVRVGCPPSLEQMVQEFGRAGRDGRPCKGVVLYHESDLQHVAFWYKEQAPERKLEIAEEFQASSEFVNAHLAGKCRRTVILEHFSDDGGSAMPAGDQCCDVCQSEIVTSDATEAVQMVIQAVKDIPGSVHFIVSSFYAGQGMSYMPGASSLAATHRGKVKNLRLSTLRDTQMSCDHRACILRFEKECTSVDTRMEKETKASHLEDYAGLGHPYVRDYMLTSKQTWVLCMSPLMSKLLSDADFAEADVTYKASVEFEYLFNMVVFNVVTLRWHVVARVRLSALTAEAYQHCFQAIFSTVKKDHPHFSVGGSLQGIVLDWSDHQMKGLEEAVGEETAAQVAKGCRVHFLRSVKRVSERVNKGNPAAHRAFQIIAHQLPDVNEQGVLTLFDVLAGERDITDALPLCDRSKALQKYAAEHLPETWKPLRHWVDWWKRPRHLRMLCPAYSSNEAFQDIPDTTNAVESHNRVSKGRSPDILSVAMMATYKVDMAAALEHLAKSQGIPTSYDDLTPAARTKRSKVSNAARKRKRAGDDCDGPPDKHQHFKRVKTAPDVNDSAAAKKDTLVVGKMSITATDLTSLENGSELTDVHMAAAGALLQRDFPNSAGYQSTLVLGSGRGKAEKEGAINLHYESERKHWVASMTTKSSLRYFDSMYKGSITPSLLSQLKTVCPSAKTVQVVRVQQQQGVKDCGLFAIAYATHLANKQDPSKVKFCQQEMRGHFASCLREGKMKMFPQDSVVKRVARPDIKPLI